MAIINSTSEQLNDARVQGATISVRVREKDELADPPETLADRVEAAVSANEQLDDGTQRQRSLTFSIDDANADLVAAGWAAGDAAEFRRLHKLVFDAWRIKLGH